MINIQNCNIDQNNDLGSPHNQTNSSATATPLAFGAKMGPINI